MSQASCFWKILALYCFCSKVRGCVEALLRDRVSDGAIVAEGCILSKVEQLQLTIGLQ